LKEKESPKEGKASLGLSTGGPVFCLALSIGGVSIGAAFFVASDLALASAAAAAKLLIFETSVDKKELEDE
jgi:hypothetical protein